MAWYNPFSWFSGGVRYSEDNEGNYTYTLTDPRAGKFLSAFKGGYSELNMLRIFMTVPEAFAVVDAIASRVINGDFYVRRKSDGAPIDSKTHLNNLLKQPNPFQKGDDFIYAMVVYKLVCGNRYTYKKQSALLANVYTSVKTLWQLRPQVTTIQLKRQRPNLFEATDKSDFIEKYVTWEDGREIKIDPQYVSHDTDVSVQHFDGEIKFKGFPSLRAAEYPISNLCAVYEARNVIYVKRGPLGAIVSRKKEGHGGSASLLPSEKKEIREELNNDFGLQGGKDLIAVTGEDIDFVQFGATIKDLLPLDETRACMYAIAATQGVPRSVLPQDKGTTFANAKEEERGLYTNRVIPEAQEICDVLNGLLGLDNEAFEIAVTFEHVEVMQADRKASAEASDKETTTALKKYKEGMITKNQARKEMGEDPVPGEDYYYKDDPQRLEYEQQTQGAPRQVSAN